MTGREGSREKQEKDGVDEDSRRPSRWSQFVWFCLLDKGLVAGGGGMLSLIFFFYWSPSDPPDGAHAC